MSFKTPILCDRRVYDKKGKWKSPNNDIAENVFYFVKEPLTMESTYDPYGREEVKETMTITIFGGKPIVKEDTITLYDGTTMRVKDVVPIFYESNILIRDMVKQRIASMEIILE